ncbi:hypothetical protein NXH76_12055 [Blautia schinkii]|nr:hypothetical protein [Blautia schinkii]
MDDIDLQKTLIARLEKIFEHFTLANNKTEPVHVNVYPQELPAKEGKNDDKHFPYVLVCLDEEEIRESEFGPEGIASVYFVVGVKDDNKDKNGHFDVARMMNMIVESFLECPVVGMKYRVRFPINKKFQEEETHPYYIGGITTFWTVPLPNMRETEYD